MENRSNPMTSGSLVRRVEVDAKMLTAESRPPPAHLQKGTELDLQAVTQAVAPGSMAGYTLAVSG
jgi:hypothetical protein